MDDTTLDLDLIEESLANGVAHDSTIQIYSSIDTMVLSPSYLVMNDDVLSPNMQVTTPMKELILKTSENENFKKLYETMSKSKSPPSTNPTRTLGTFPKGMSTSFRDVSIKACERYIQVKRLVVANLKANLSETGDSRIQIPPRLHIVALHFTSFKRFITGFLKGSLTRDRIEKTDYHNFGIFTSNTRSKKVIYSIVVTLTAKARNEFLIYEDNFPVETEARINNYDLGVRKKTKSSDELSFSANISMDTETSAAERDIVDDDFDDNNDNDHDGVIDDDNDDDDDDEGNKSDGNDMEI